MSSTLRTIRLGGVLGKKFGRTYRLAVSSAAEATHALCQMVPGFEKFLWESKEKGLAFAVFVGNRNVGEDELTNPSAGDIRLVPIVIGAKTGGVMAIFGAILVIVGIFLIWTPFGAPLIAVGVGLMAAGVAMMLAPQPKDPKSEDDADKRSSYAFNGPVNTQAQGNPVPILYGGDEEKGIVVGSAVISASIDAQEQAYVPRTGVGHGGGSRTSHGDWVAKQAL
jgi:predicted phage tail protein